jgi:hypothetical protein
MKQFPGVGSCGPGCDLAEGRAGLGSLGRLSVTSFPEGHRLHFDGRPVGIVISAGPSEGVGLTIFAIETARFLIWELLLRGLIPQAAFRAGK